MQHKTVRTKIEKREKKFWTTFTYHSPKIRKITNPFKNTNIGISFRKTTTMHQIIKPTIADQTLDHENSGVYQLTCNTCHRSYIGQTSRILNQDSSSTHITSKTINHNQLTYYISSSADMNMATSTAP